MSKGADLERRFGRNLYESLGARNTEDTVFDTDFSAFEGVPTHSELGRNPIPVIVNASPADGRTRLREAGVMELSRITPDPDQPRKAFNPDAIDRLALSLKTHGQLQPIRVRWSERLGKWIIIAGERRYRAAVAAGLTTIQCIFVEKDEEAVVWLAEQMVENCLREDLSPIEQALAFDRLIKTQGWSARRLAEEIHVSASSVSKALALLNLPDDLRRAVDSGAISATAGYELARINDPERRGMVAASLLNKELKRDELASFNRDLIGRGPAESARDSAEEPQADADRPQAQKSKTSKPKSKSSTEPEANSEAAAAAISTPTAPEMEPSPENDTALPAETPSAPIDSFRRYKLKSGAEFTIRLPTPNASTADFMEAVMMLATIMRAQTNTKSSRRSVAELIDESSE